MIGYEIDKNTIVLKKLNAPLSMQIDIPNDAALLEEVFVTGYHNVKKENATGAYQSISSKELDKRYTGDVLKNLEGKVPGLVIYNNGLNDGGEGAITIRGTGSFNAKTSPLIVVDGLPIEGGLGSVNPYNIANITVLKDAAAASIYGARASNGVIVITTKRATSSKIEVNFSADLNISERKDYSYMRWANAGEMIDLEKANFSYIKNNPSQSAFNNVKSNYKTSPYTLSPIVRMLMANYLGDLSTADMNSALDALSKNDFRKEWQDFMERTQVTQQYDLSLRHRGKNLNSSIVLNYRGDNLGMAKERQNTLTFSYRGILDVAKWMNLEFGVNVINDRSKKHAFSWWNGINSYQPYMSMYNTNGSFADMEAEVMLNAPSLSDKSLGLKSEAYNFGDEINRNFTRARETNIRSFVHATAKIIDGWNLSGQFQYEDIYSKNDSYLEAESYDMRHLYNIYTDKNGVHNMPNGGMLKSAQAEGAYYTFRTQTDYSHDFAEKHNVEALLGFEYRETNYKSKNDVTVGYDDRSQTNNMGTTNFGMLTALEGTQSALGKDYTMNGAPSGADFSSSNVLHRYYSVYFNGAYTYNHRYNASVSYRVDKTDLFGADPKFRGRPLWSIGAGWNIANESWLGQLDLFQILKLRASYGLTGNIDQSVSSYLTASVGVNEMNGVRYASLNTPPNDQLRWEKTASFNIGIDYAMLSGRLSGSIDWYRKNGSDLLTVTDLDPTTGWNSLTINNGKALNTGVEIQVDGVILPARSRKQVGVNASLSYAYNHNEVTSVNHTPATGLEALSSYTLHKGYPIHSIFSYRYAGMEEKNGIQTFGWYDHEGNVHYSDVASDEFKPEDAVYCGSLDPKHTVSFTPEVTWNGFTLGAMFAYYGGHKMRARIEEWTSEGSQFGYSSLAEIEAIPKSYINYWNSDSNKIPANGYPGSTNVVGDYRYLDAAVVPADFLKLRNVVLSYEFPRSVCQRINAESLRLRIQANNLFTWHRNNLGVDPEACNPSGGETMLRLPRSYTMSLSVMF
ncbi:MAG: SusC/RagA family TonB-linked outer membrane protein [Prevotellaceae bacterium]|nr:SusC/RagA family TonB-linked outer membrane protein [Candidatus Minthosoma caballi]